MSELDDMLQRLGETAPPDALAAMDAIPLFERARQRQTRTQLRAIGTVAALALMVGAMSALLPDKPAPTIAIAAPLDLAPSSLLSTGA
jgi:ferric-dicitrate binding protein FerR (iron transport regulator)